MTLDTKLVKEIFLEAAEVSEEAAATLGLSRAMAYRHWTYARAWLCDAVSQDEAD